MQPLLLSKSRMNCYCQCPEKYRLTYVEKIIHRTPTAMIEGSALHHIVENVLCYGKAIPNLVDEVSKEFWKDIKLSDTEYADEDALNDAKSKTLAEAKTFLNMIGELNTDDMEGYVEQPLTDPRTGEVDKSIIIRGYVDLIDRPEKHLMRVIDIKTTAKSPAAENANRALELTTYAYLMACVYGFHAEFPVAFLYLVRSKQPKIVWQNSQRSMPDFIAVHKTIYTIANAIRQNIFYQNIGLHCAWCQHQNICFGEAIADAA